MPKTGVDVSKKSIGFPIVLAVAAFAATGMTALFHFESEKAHREKKLGEMAFRHEKSILDLNDLISINKDWMRRLAEGIETGSMNEPHPSMPAGFWISEQVAGFRIHVSSPEERSAVERAAAALFQRHLNVMASGIMLSAEIGGLVGYGGSLVFALDSSSSFIVDSSIEELKPEIVACVDRLASAGNDLKTCVIESSTFVEFSALVLAKRLARNGAAIGVIFSSLSLERIGAELGEESDDAEEFDLILDRQDGVVWVSSEANDDGIGLETRDQDDSAFAEALALPSYPAVWNGPDATWLISRLEIPGSQMISYRFGRAGSLMSGAPYALVPLSAILGFVVLSMIALAMRDRVMRQYLDLATIVGERRAETVERVEELVRDLAIRANEASREVTNLRRRASDGVREESMRRVLAELVARDLDRVSSQIVRGESPVEAMKKSGLEAISLFTRVSGLGVRAALKEEDFSEVAIDSLVLDVEVGLRNVMLERGVAISSKVPAEIIRAKEKPLRYLVSLLFETCLAHCRSGGKISCCVDVAEEEIFIEAILDIEDDAVEAIASAPEMDLLKEIAGAMGGGISEVHDPSEHMMSLMATLGIAGIVHDAPLPVARDDQSGGISAA